MSESNIIFNQGTFDGEKFGLGKAVIAGSLHCPVEAKQNSHFDAAFEKVLKWALDYKIIADDPQTDAEKKKKKKDILKLNHYAAISANFFPYCSFESLEVAIQFMANTFWYDDLIDDKDALIDDTDQIDKIQEGFLRTLDGVLPIREQSHSDHIHALYRTWLDMARRLRAKDDLVEFIKGVSQTFDSFILVRKANQKSALSFEDDYVNLRRHSSGVYPTLEMGRIVNEIILSAKQRENIIFKTIYQYAADHIWLINDAFSFPKEIDGHFKNLVLIRHKAHGGDLQRAFDDVIRLANDKMKAFMEWSEYLPPEGDPFNRAIHSYAEMLKTCMRGNIHWTLETARYAAG